MQAFYAEAVSISKQNVELTRQAYDALNRRDLDAFLATMDTDVDAVSLLVAMEGDYHGHAGIRRWWESLLNAFPDFAIEVVEVRDLGDVALATLRTRGHGSDTDTPFEMPLWQLVRFRRGKCVWWRSYGSESEALEATGLRE
jgi:ketosteroid isomerase-like protein